MSGNPNLGDRAGAVVRTVELPPDPRVAEALGLQHTIETALADIIDNSIEANATSVWLRFVVESDRLERILILDDGDGMAAGNLEAAMRLGARREYSVGALGMYGIGLKASAFSLAEGLTVVSTTGDEHPSAMTVPRTQGEGAFRAFVHSTEDAATRLAASEMPFGITHGTLIDLRFIRGSSVDDNASVRRAWLDDRVRRLRNHLGLVFHRFIDSGRIRLTIDTYDTALLAAGVPFHPVGIDPFRVATGKLGYPRSMAVDLPEGQTASIACHILAPGVKSGDARIHAEDRTDWQGIFVYRNDRLLRLGGWGEVAPKKSDTQLARALLEITDDNIRWFGMNAEKNGVALSPELTRAIQGAGDEDASFKDFLQDARDVLRQSNRREQSLKPIAAMGSGMPLAVEELAGEVFGFREYEKSVNVRWQSFPAGRIFAVDHDRATIWLNERHREQLSAGTAEDRHGLIKTLLFLLFEFHFSKAGIQQITRDRILAIEAMIGAALGIEVAMDRAAELSDVQLELPGQDDAVEVEVPNANDASEFDLEEEVEHEAADSEPQWEAEPEAEPETETPPVGEWKTDSVRQYMDVVGRHPLLRADEEVSLARRIETGVFAAERLEQMEPADRRSMLGRELAWVARDGERARDRMVASNLRLVMSIAKRYQRHGMELLDLIQEGNAGLVHAVEKFDYTKGFKFSTYATWWIRQAITRALADKGATIRMPVHMTEFGSRIAAERSKLSASLDRPATDAEIAAAMGEDVSKISLHRRMSQPLFSLNAPLVVISGDDDDDLEADEFGAARETVVEFGEVIEDEFDMVEAAIAQSMMRSQIDAVLLKLNEREAEVLSLRFGLGGDEPKTLDQIGDVFHVTRERIRQIEAKALKRLREPAIMDALGLVPPPTAIAAASVSAESSTTTVNPVAALTVDAPAATVDVSVIYALVQAYRQLRHVRSAAALANVGDRDAAIILARLLLWEDGPIDDHATAPNHGSAWDPAEADRVTEAHLAHVPLAVIAESTGRTQLAIAWRLLDNTTAPVVVPPEFDTVEAVAATWAVVEQRLQGEAAAA